MEFVHLNVHSNFSLLSGTNTVEEIVERAVGLGMSMVALTDTNGLYGVVPFMRACGERGIRPIYGCELRAGGHRAVLLARNRDGYSEICRCITRFHLDEAGFDIRGELAGASGNVYILTDDEELLRGLSGHSNVYVELCNHGDGESRQRVFHLHALGNRLGLRCAATNRVHFLGSGDFGIHRVLTAIRTNRTIGTLSADEHVHSECWLKSSGEMERLFIQVPESLENAAQIGWDCEVELGLGRIKPPRFSVPAGETPFSYLCKLAFQGLSERYHPITKRAYDTLNKELDVIHKLDLAEYFLICWDIVRFARGEGMYCLGRGSAANSIVSYCLRITHVDPLEHNLFFERFLNLERSSMPDFDIDFGTDDREVVFRYVFDRYGEENVAMICTYSTLRARSAIREVGKALGIPAGEVDGFVKRLPHFADARGLAEQLRTNPETRDLPIDRQPFRSIVHIAERIAGFPRHLSTHPCGIVISPSPITDFVPLQRGDKGLIITQWSMYPIEDAGLIKIDLLGQKGLAVIKDTVAMVERHSGQRLHFETVDCLSDGLTRQWMRKGLTEGCFYIESPTMMSLIQQAGCDEFEVLTALSSIIRPGVSNYGGKKMYLKRHLGLEKITYLHPKLEQVMKDTYGCLIYQEQVIQVASVIAGMSLAEADGLRKCMSKKRNWERMETYKAAFYEGARRNNIPVRVIDLLYSQIESFAGYAFCKAHSASFALESFQSMYLKSHYPAEFMAAVLSNEGGYYSQAEYVEEARRLGIRILRPCVNRSGYRYTGKKDSIRVGLMQVKSCVAEHMESLVSERDRNGPFRDLRDFLRRVFLSKAETRNLILCGAMDSFGMNRPQLLWTLELVCPEQSGLQETGSGDELLAQMPAIRDYPAAKKLRMELDILGFTVESHPLMLFREKLARVRKLRPVVVSSRLSEYVRREVYCFGWIVSSKKTRTQNTGELMKFVTFSDENGRFEGVFFPRVFERYAVELLKAQGPFLVKGRVDKEFGYQSMTVSHVKLL